MADVKKKYPGPARVALVIAAFACLALASAYLLWRTPSDTGTPEPTNVPAEPDGGIATVALGSTATLVVGSAVTFDGGLVVTLDAIDDSRCPKDVQCIWAGELSPSLHIRGGAVGENEMTLRMGTMTAPIKGAGGYAFAIVSADEKTVTLRVSLAVAVPEGWVTVREQVLGYSFSHPAKLGGNVWNAVEWPPAVTVMPAGQDPLKSGCRAFASGTGGAETLVKKGEGEAVNATYVRYEGSGVGAGNLYQEYCYEVKGAERSYVVDVVIRSHTGCGDGQCGAYCDTPNEKECRELDRRAAYEEPLEKMLGTFVVLQRP